MTHLNRPTWIGHNELRPQKTALGIPADADMMPIDMARCLVLVWVDSDGYVNGAMPHLPTDRAAEVLRSLSAHLATRADRIERGGEL